MRRRFGAAFYIAPVYQEDEAGMGLPFVAAAVGEVLGRPIEAAAPDFDTWMAAAKLPYDEHQKGELKAMYDYYDRYGLVGNPLTLRAVLGREPRPMRQFFADLAAGVTTTAGQGPSFPACGSI